jgi:DNA-binding FadR family transcriptional regulator
MQNATNCAIGQIMKKTETEASLARLRKYLEDQNLGLNDRLPPERDLCVELQMSRASLRKAMSVLESEGHVWRQVGRGTFIGARPVLNLGEVQYLSSISSPAQIIDARLAVEPELARLAASFRIASDLAELRLCHRRCKEANDWQVFEAWDNRFHYAIAAATKNKILIILFETLNAVRRSQVWRAVRVGAGPTPSHTTFTEHDAIYQAILKQDADAAADRMRDHLVSVRSRLIFRAQTTNEV